MNRGTYSYAVCPSGFTELCSCVRRSGASLFLPPAAAARCAGWAEGLSSSVCPLLQLLLGTITFISISPLGQHCLNAGTKPQLQGCMGKAGAQEGPHQATSTHSPRCSWYLCADIGIVLCRGCSSATALQLLPHGSAKCCCLAGCLSSSLKVTGNNLHDPKK